MTSNAPRRPGPGEILVTLLVSAASAVILFQHFVAGPRAERALTERLGTIDTQIGDLRADLDDLPRRLAQRPAPLRNADPAPPESLPSGDIAVLRERIDDLATEIFDLRRNSERNLQLALQHIMRRFDELAAPRASATDEEMRNRRRELAAELQRGGIVLQENGTTLEARGRFASPTRVLEILMATEGGRLHESLFLLDARPSTLMSGLIALGLDPEHGAGAAETGAPPKGDPVYIYVLWPGRKTPVRAEDCVLNREKQEALDRGPWVLTGSSFTIHMGTGKQYFQADTNQIAVSLCWIYSGVAVLASPDAATANEYIWEPNDVVLPKDRSVELTFYFCREPRPEWDSP